MGYSIKRYNLLDGEAYGKRYQMVEETNGDWVWYEDVEAQCAELESKCAELLEALEGCIVAVDNGEFPSFNLYSAARAAIAKAERGDHEF